MNFNQFLVFEKKLPPLGKSHTGSLEATFTTSKDRDVTINFFKKKHKSDNLIAWEVMFEVDYTTIRTSKFDDDMQEILQGILAYMDQFFKMKLEKDVVHFSGTSFRAAPYEKIAQTVLWKRSKARNLYILRDGSVHVFFVYTDLGEKFAKEEGARKVK